MKKIALLSLVAALAVPAVANAADAPAASPAPAATAPATAPAAGGMMAPSKVELKDGSWAQINADGTVKVSKDGGKTWQDAPDGTWEAKDGAKITTKGGKKA